MKLTPKDLAPQSLEERTARGMGWGRITGFAQGDYDGQMSMRMYLGIR